MQYHQVKIHFNFLVTLVTLYLFVPDERHSYMRMNSMPRLGKSNWIHIAFAVVAKIEKAQKWPVGTDNASSYTRDGYGMKI